MKPLENLMSTVTTRGPMRREDLIILLETNMDIITLLEANYLELKIEKSSKD